MTTQLVYTPAARGDAGPHCSPATATSIAVVIVNYNSGEHLARCLDAVTAQTRAADRVLVVDNGSTDGSCDECAGRWPRVELVRLGRNTGFAAANNRAIELCAGAEWVALLNADAFPEPGWLAALERAAREFPEFDALASLLVAAFDPARLDGAGDAYHASGFAWRVGCGEERARTQVEAGEVFAPCAAAAMYRRRAVVEVGGFDERYFCYFEDVDLGLRLRLAGYRARLVPEAVVHHVGSPTAGRHGDFTVYHAHRNLVWTWWKNMPAALVVCYLPQHVLLQLLSLVWFTLRGQARVIGRAKWDALVGLPAMWRARRRARTLRRIGVAELRRQMARGWLEPYLRRRD